jgi:putative SOS response-associated peptidase YedK
MTQQTSPEVVARIFDAEVRESSDEPFAPSWNVAPTDPVTVVLQREDGRAVERHRWGLVPSWATSLKEGARHINARAETVAESAAFRTSFRKRRCIIPADGFYEWQRVGEKRKQPWFLGPHEEQALLAMAGLWSVWKDPATGLWVLSASVITTDANDDVGRLHDRMPVLLPREAWATWLDPDQQDHGLLRSLLHPAPDGVLEMHPVSRRVNDVREDGPDLVDRVPDEQTTDAAPAEVPPTGSGRGRRSSEAAGQGTLFD